MKFICWPTLVFYHHENHKKKIRKSAILKLQTPDGVIEGHKLCSEFLEREVKNLLLTDAGLDNSAKEVLLNEIEPCFTEADNLILKSPPDQDCVKKTVESSNLHGAPGSDGLPSLL